MSMKKVVESPRSQMPSEELRERRRRCFIASSFSKNSQGAMPVDESRTKRFTLAMTKEQEINFFRSLWKSVPDKSCEDSTMPKPPEANLTSEDDNIKDDAAESKLVSNHKKICGNHFDVEAGIGIVTIGDDCGVIQPAKISRRTRKARMVSTNTTLDSDLAQRYKDLTSTGCGTSWPILDDPEDSIRLFPDVEGKLVNGDVSEKGRSALQLNNNITSPRGESQTKTTTMSTHEEIPKSNCRTQSSSMTAELISGGPTQTKSAPIRMFPRQDSFIAELDLPNVDDMSFPNRKTDCHGLKFTKNVSIQTSPLKKFNHSNSAQSLGEKGHRVESEAKVKYGRKWNNDHVMIKKRQPRSFGTNLNNKQYLYGERREKSSNVGQRRRLMSQNDNAHCVCDDQCSKVLHPKKNVNDRNALHKDENRCGCCRKCHTRCDDTLPNAKVQCQIRNPCSNSNGNKNYCVLNVSTRGNADYSKTCSCSIQKQREGRKVNICSLNSRMLKEKNCQSHLNVKNCGFRYFKQDTPNPQMSFRSSKGRPLKEGCTCNVSKGDTSSCRRESEDIVEIQDESDENDASSASSGFCEACGVRGNSDKQMLSHLKGRRHFRMMRETEMKFQNGGRVSQSSHAEDSSDDQVKVWTYHTTYDKQHLASVGECVVVKKIVVLV